MVSTCIQNNKTSVGIHKSGDAGTMLVSMQCAAYKHTAKRPDKARHGTIRGRILSKDITQVYLTRHGTAH